MANATNKLAICLIGAETGLTLHPSAWFFHRERLACEYFAARTLEFSQVDAQLATVSLRGGVDLGVSAGSHALVLALAAGLDIVRISPERTREPSLTLTAKTTDLVPVWRSELRYELAVWSLLLSVSLLADTSLVFSHYDLRDGETLRRIAAPWRLRPGFALTVGWQPTLSKRE